MLIYENVCIFGCMNKDNETQKDLENGQQKQLATYKKN